MGKRIYARISGVKWRVSPKILMVSYVIPLKIGDNHFYRIFFVNFLPYELIVGMNPTWLAIAV